MTSGKRVVKALNIDFADLLKRQAAGIDVPVPVYAGGDHADARTQVISFVEELAMVASESGPLGKARYLEATAEMMIQLWCDSGHVAEIGFALVTAA